ncbi:hypothetical protein DFH29DRAFT_1007611 [Suillus ampliporus]|nr:hypothetical protein DFH29DRAFT_1007611 [Suillus ampliporus]
MSVPTCPNCGKVFTKDSSVTRHLSQPHTSCHSSIRDVVNMSQFAEVEWSSRHALLEADATMHNSDDQVHANFDSNFNPIDDDFGAAEGSLEERYEGAGMCYSEDGLTFLDLFDADEFTEYREPIQSHTLYKTSSRG